MLDLAEEVERLRRAGVTRSLLATAFAALGWPDDPQGRYIVREEIARLPRSNLPRHRLREEYKRTTPEERVLQLSALTRSLGEVLRARA